MDKGSPPPPAAAAVTAAAAAAALQSLHLNPAPRKPSLLPFSLPLRNSKPRRLVSLCLGVLGQHLEDIIVDIIDAASAFPPEIKLALMAIAKRRNLLNDEVLVALADNSWELLDISGSDVTDSGLEKAAQVCTYVRAVDISRCAMITAVGVSELIRHCRSLEILRCGGTSRSDSAARRSLNILKPRLNDTEEESWEELDSMNIGNGAESLRWLVWPKIDEESKITLATECPRIIVNPQPSLHGIRGVQVPQEALANVVLDHAIVKDINPKTWAVTVGVAQRAPAPPASAGLPEIPMAERFRLAFLERDERLAPKRAKNERQNRRRMEKEKMMGSTDAKSIVLASQAIRFLHRRS